jgi:DNA-binding beta-propeller fold protein YncE
MRDVIATLFGGVAVVLSCAFEVDAVTVRPVSVVSNDVAYDAVNGRLYVSVPSSAGATGNSLRVIDPATATAGASVFVGSEPGKIAVSDNGQYAYVGLNGAPAVRRVDLATFTAGLQFALGSDSFLGPFYVDDIEAMPGSPGTVAVSRRNVGFSPRHEGVAIYDDGVKRTTETPGHTGSNVIEFGANPATLYGYNNETTDFGFRTMAVSASGVQITNNTSGLISGFGGDFDYGGGKVVSTTGKVIDPVTRSILGTIGSTGPVAVEADGSRAYVLSGTSINVYDLSTFLKLDTIPVTGLTGGVELVRFGSDGLAVRSPSAVYLVNSTSIVPEPGSGLALLAGALAAVAGGRWRRSV